MSIDWHRSVEAGLDVSWRDCEPRCPVYSVFACVCVCVCVCVHVCVGESTEEVGEPIGYPVGKSHGR